MSAPVAPLNSRVRPRTSSDRLRGTSATTSAPTAGSTISADRMSKLTAAPWPPASWASSAGNIRGTAL